MAEKYVNVVALTAKQQAALRYCLFNWMQQTVLYCMEKIISVTDETYDMLDLSMKTMVKYEKLSCLFPSVLNQFTKAKTNLFYFEAKDFDTIVESVNMYNAETTDIVLGEDIEAVISIEIPKLKELILESKKHQFTVEELKKLMKAGG